VRAYIWEREENHWKLWVGKIKPFSYTMSHKMPPSPLRWWYNHQFSSVREELIGKVWL
jgi:hypothetical protein